MSLKRPLALLLALLCLGVYASGAIADGAEARLSWVRTAALGSPVSGVVAAVEAAPGAAVAAGAPLVRLDARGFEARVAGAEAAVREHEVAREEARRELDRAQEMYDRTVLSEHELQLARIGFTRADARYEAARAALVQARLDLEHSTLRAPFAARVVSVHAAPGEAVAADLQPRVLVTVAEAGRMAARALLPAARLSGLAAGDAVTVTVAGREYAGEVRHVGLEPVDGEPGEPRYALEAVFAVTDDAVLRPGQPARLEWP